MSKDSPAPASNELQAVPIDLHTPQLTIRAVLTGMVLGGLLSVCNIYAGLTIGWGMNMSITSAILAYGFWHTMHLAFHTRPWSILENNINQTAGTAAAAVSSAGLVAGIPALSLLAPEKTLPWIHLSIWTFSVCLVGIAIAVGMRKQLIITDKLPFPTGIATAATLREIHSQGAEAMRKVVALLGAAVVASAMFVLKYTHVIASWAPTSWHVSGFSLKSLTFSLNPSLLMYGVGIIVGLRTTTWLILGSILGWLVLAPPLIRQNYIRLTISEPLPMLPEGIVLPPEPEGYAKYNTDKKQLEWKGQMSDAERARLLAMSDDPLFRQAIERFYVRSQLSVRVPLSLPASTSTGALPVEYDSASGMLKAKNGLTAADRTALLDASPDPVWRDAVTRLHASFQYETTRPLVFSRVVPRMPAGFGLPQKWTGFMRYERSKGKLSVMGRLPEQALADGMTHVDEALRQHPSHQTDIEKFRTALVELQQESAAPLLSAVGLVDLTPLVRYNPADQRLTARGVLAKSDEDAAIAAASGNATLVAGVKSVSAASKYQPAQATFADVVAWLLWPGVALMVVSSIVSFGFSWRSIARTFSARRSAEGDVGDDVPAQHLVSNKLWLIGILVAGILSVALQMIYFEITWWAASIGVVLSFALALVAGRVAGETNTTPVGAMGKVTQLVFGAIAPGSPAPNLMAATVTGGAASKCAELLFDLKAGRLVGASPKYQTFAQVCGALAGATIGTAGYLLLLPNPKDQLFSEPFTAPAVTTWKAVAELFMIGFKAIPEGTPTAIVIACAFGVLLPVLEKILPKKAAAFVPSPAAIGLSFVIQGDVAVAMFLGAAIAALISKAYPDWSKRFLVTLAAGMVAGDSMSGAGVALYEFTKL
ncbi:MAG: OPT/YSL family transporter [Phycisphaerales bacterium]|nr:OPT/YSL family transporter [Phycisphaerales bacterium]